MDTHHVPDSLLTVPPGAFLPPLFLTSTIQVLWQTDAFRKNFRAIKKHTNCQFNTCSFCALKSVYLNFQHHKYAGLPPNIVQRAASILQSGSGARFESASEGLSAILSSLDTTLSTPLGEELFGSRIREILPRCECGYKGNPDPEVRFYLSLSMKQVSSLFESVQLSEHRCEPLDFSRLLHQALLTPSTIPCPNQSECSREITPILEVLSAPPVLAIEVLWCLEGNELSEDLGLFLDTMDSSLQSDELLMTDLLTENKRKYSLTAIVCLLEGREVCFTLHSGRQMWVRSDSDSVKLADGTFSQLLSYLRQDSYFPALLVFSDPHAATPTEPVPAAVALPHLVPGTRDEPDRLSNVWEEEHQNISLLEGNSKFLHEPPHSPTDLTVVTEDGCSYGYLDFGLASKEAHGGRIDLSGDLSLSPQSDGSFQNIQVFVHSPSNRTHDDSHSEVEFSPPSPDTSRHSFPPAQLREHTQRRTSQKHVPSIPTPFALLWQLPMFRRSLQSVKGHVCTLKTCVYCVYQLILERFDYKDIPVVPPELLRRAMALCFEREKGYNLELSFDDVSKTYEELLARIHYNLTGGQDMTACAALHCVTHQKFAASFTLSGECPCGHKLDPSSSLELVYSVSAQSLIEETRREVSPNLSGGKRFEHILRDIGAVQDTQPCANSSCKLPLRIQRSLNNRPDVFTISLNWDGLPLTPQNLDDVISSIGVSLRLTEVFSQSDNMLKFRPLYLTAIVARQDLSYAFFFHHCTLHAWYCMDDARITTLGDKWPVVLRALRSLSYQAILLVYTDPLFSPLDNSSAPTECVVSAGAEGERIRRENLFPSISESVPNYRNRPGSPESMYSSDAELFQWRAGERLSPDSESVKPEVLLAESPRRAADESESEHDLEENMGTFRVNEGADGDGRTLFDIISLSPDSAKESEAPLLTPPSLWLLRQLDSLGKGLVGIREHKCDGTLCLLCALIQAHLSKDYCFPPAILRPMLALAGDGEKAPAPLVVANYQHLLTRLHNSLCEEGQEMRLDDTLSSENRNIMCESSACITHQRLSTQLELLQDGKETILCSRMVLEVSARDLTKKIKDINSGTPSTPSHPAGSIRVMRLFAQAARSILELPGSAKSRRILLANSPDVLAFSLRWEKAPDRDEAADFYERISPAVQPQDLFHQTRDPHLSRRMYYLMGIVTQSPSYCDAWVYSREVSSWTHFSTRTHSVTVMGPQLSSVWHACRASSSTHTPLFLLYSNPASTPFDPSPSRRSTLTPSHPLPQEGIVVFKNQPPLTDHFSVQNGINEALSFFDATLRQQEILLSPSPLPLPLNPLLGTRDSSLQSDPASDHVQVSGQSQFTSPLSDCPFSSSLFTSHQSKFAEHNTSPPLSLSPQSVAPLSEMECAERLSIVIFTLLQMNHFRLSLLQTHDQVVEETPLIALKQIFHIAIAVPHLIPSKFIPVSCQHLGLLSELNSSTSPDLYVEFISRLFSRFPLNPFVNFLKQSMLIRVQHKDGTLYTQIVLPVSANRMVAQLRSTLPDAQKAIPSPKLFSSIIRQMLTYDGTSLSLMSSPDIIPVHLQWNPDVINSPDTEFIVQHISPTLLMRDLFPLVANKFISHRVLYLYGMIVSVNQVQLVIYYTTDIQSWIIYDGTHFEKIGLVWQDVRYFLESNYCRPDLLLYLNPTSALLDTSSLQRGLPEISHTKTNPGLSSVAEEILTELFPRDDPSHDPPSIRLVQDVVRPAELQKMAQSPVRMVLSNEASNEDVLLIVNAGSLEGLENIGLGSSYDSSLHRRQLNRNGLLNGQNAPAPYPAPPSRSSSDTSTFRKGARASYLPFFTSLVALWSIDVFRESLLRLEMQVRTPEYLPLVSRLKQMFSTSIHATSLTPPLDLFQSLSSRLLNSSQFAGSGTQVFDAILTLLREELKRSISFQGPDPIEKSRLIQNLFSLTLQQSGKCRCGAIYDPIEFNQNLLHLNLDLYLPFAKKTCNKYTNINNVPNLAHKAIRETLLLMNKLKCQSQTCDRTYLASPLLVTAPRALCLALDYGDHKAELNSLLPALPTSLQVDKLFTEIGPNARASHLLYLTGVMAEISQERALHLYYHTGRRTWVSVDGMGYKDLGIWTHVVEEIYALNAKPSTLFYTNPLDFSHQYQNSALATPLGDYKRSRSAPEPSNPSSPDLRAERIVGLTSSSADQATSDPQYVPIQDINNKKKMNGRHHESKKHLRQHSASSSEETGSREDRDRDRERPPLPLRVSHSKESLEGIDGNLTKPGSAHLSHYSSVSELSTLAGMPSSTKVERAGSAVARTAPGKLTQQNGVKPKSKHKKASSITLLNKLNPKTYFKKKDKVRIPQVVHTTQEYPPSDLDNTSPRLSELMDTPNLKKERFTQSEENYTDHLDQLFSSGGMPETPARPHRSPDRQSRQQPAPSFLTPKTYTAENLGRYDQVVQQFKEKSPPRPEEVPQPRPRNAATMSRSMDLRVPRPHRDPFETSLAAHLLLQMINFSSYYQSVLNFCKLRIKKKHQIIQALDALFKRASSHSVNQMDIVEYLNTCMPSMIGSSEIDTGHRLFHQLHWSFQPHGEAFKERFSLQVEDTGRAGGVKEVYFVVTAVSDWLSTFEQSLQHNDPVTHNHKVLREGLKRILPPVCQHVRNCPDQFYLAVDYDREVEAVSTWKIWNCIPTLLTLRDLSPLAEARHSLHKPFYLTGVISRTETGALSSYCYVESRRMWCCYSSSEASNTAMQHWDELLAHVTTHSIYPFALLYTSTHSQPLFSSQPSASPVHTARTAAPPPAHTASDSLASSLDRVRYHTLTPHPSVPLDIGHDLTTQLLSTLLLTPGFSASFSPPAPQSPFLSEVRSLISSSLLSFSTRQQPVSVFAQRNLRPDAGGDHSPSSLYSQLVSKLCEGDPSLSQRLCLSVADRGGEELLPSVSLSLSAYLSQATNIPRFSKLNPKHCRIALKSVSSIKNKQIQNAARLICLSCEQERVNRDILSQLPPQLQLSYLGAVAPKRHLQQLSYYLTGLLLSSPGEAGVEAVYTSAVYLCPREKWILFKTGSLSEGEELSWLNLCERIKSSQFYPLFCFYSNESVMGHYSASFAAPSMPPLLSPPPVLPTPDMSSPLLSGQFIFQTTNTQPGMIDLRMGHTDYLGPTTSLTDTNPPPEMLQELFSAGRTTPPFITFPSPPSDTSPPPSILLITPDIHTYSSLPPLTTNRGPDPCAPPLFVAAVSMLWHLPFFRQAVLLSRGHFCLGYSCPMCALKSLFALHYYSRAYALPSRATSLAHRHAFAATDSCRSIGELVPAIARMTDESLKTGQYRSILNFTLEHEQGSLHSFSVSLNTIKQNITKLAMTHRFRGETHPLVFSKALANTLAADLKLRSTPQVLILDFSGDSLLTQQSALGAQIRLSDLVANGASCLSPNYYLSSLLAADPMGRTVTFSFHLEFCHWVSYDGHVAGQFPNIQQMAEFLVTNNYSLLSSLYLNPVAPRPSPHQLPQEITLSLEASGHSATIRRMQQAEEESTESKSSLYPALPPSIGFENLLEDYEREKQGVGAPTAPPVQTFIPQNSLSENFTFSAELARPPPLVSSDQKGHPALQYPPSLQQTPPVDPYPVSNPFQPLFAPPTIREQNQAPLSAHYFHPNLTPAPSQEGPHADKDLTRTLLAYPPLQVQPEAAYPPRQPPLPETESTAPPKFCFSALLHPDKSLSAAAVAELSAKLTETELWKKVFLSIPCIGESYEVTVFEQRQRKTAFNPGRAVLERIQSYQVPMEVLMDTFTHLQFQEGISILKDPSSYSSSHPSPPSDPPTRASPEPTLEEIPVLSEDPESDSTSSEEEYDPDPCSVNLAPPEAAPGEGVGGMSRSEQLDEEGELLLRRHSEEEVSLLRDYQERMEAQEARQQREVHLLKRRQLQSINEFRDELSSIVIGQPGDTMLDAPQYVPPPQLVPERMPAFPASFPPTQADMYYTQARDLYRESLNVSDFSVAFSLCVQAQNKLDLALIEPDVRLDPVKKQAFSQLRQICHQQAVKLHRRSVLRTLDPNHQFKSPPKKQSNIKSKRVKFDPKLSQPELQEEATPSPPPSVQLPEIEPPPSYSRPILRPPPLTPSLYQSIPRPPPIGRAMKEEEKENKKPDRPEHKMNYPPSRSVRTGHPPADPSSVSDSRASTPSTPSTLSTLSTFSDDLTSTSSSRPSSRSHRPAPSRRSPPTKPFFNEDHYTLLDQLIKCRREDLPPELDRSELSRKLLDSKIHSRSLSTSSTSTSASSPAPVPPPEGTGPVPKRDYFKLSTSDDTSEGVAARIDTKGRSLIPEKCRVCRSTKFFTIKGMCPECYTRHIRSTDLMIRTGVPPTDV